MSDIVSIVWLPLPPEHIVISMVIFSFASLIQSSAGFGAVIVSGPFLVLVEPRFVPGPVLLAGILINILSISRDGFRTEAREVWYLNGSSIVGSAAGAILLLHLSANGVASALSLFLMASVLASLCGLVFSVSRTSLMVTGFISGVAGTVAGLAGAATALLFQTKQGVELRSTMAAQMLPGTVISAATVALVGRLTSFELSLFLVLVPAIIAGHMSAIRYQNLFDRFVSRPLVLLLSGLGAIGVIVRQLV